MTFGNRGAARGPRVAEVVAEVAEPGGAKVVLPRAAALATMAVGGWVAGMIGAPQGAGVVLTALAAFASLDLLLRRPAAPRALPARARANDRRRRGGAPARA